MLFPNTDAMISMSRGLQSAHGKSFLDFIDPLSPWISHLGDVWVLKEALECINDGMGVLQLITHNLQEHAKGEDVTCGHARGRGVCGTHKGLECSTARADRGCRVQRQAGS